MINLKDQLRALLPQKRSRKFYAKRLGVSKSEVDRLIEEIRRDDQGAIVDDGFEDGIKMVSEKRSEDGDREVQYISKKPMNRKEIEELYGVDGINTRLSTYWNKQTASGNYLISAFIKCLITDFYTKEELAEQLKDIFPNLRPVPIKVVESDSERALFVYISDDHCGSVLKNSLYGKQNSGSIYSKRLLELSNEIKKLDYVFEHIYVINMGDEVDGWNATTTRGGHTLEGSLSNKEQFDAYTEGRRMFYDDLFTSGTAEKYTVVTVNNSNHSGLGLSYIVNKALEFYIDARYENVESLSFERIIDIVKWGNHVIGLTHGKDEKLMKNPLPLELNAKTDLWLFEFYDKLGYSPNKFFTSTIKGDIHKFNMNLGKSGRYINCPSIAGGSAWIEANFGDTKAGALMEIYEKDSPNIITIPIWFN